VRSSSLSLARMASFSALSTSVDIRVNEEALWQSNCVFHFPPKPGDFSWAIERFETACEEFEHLMWLHCEASTENQLYLCANLDAWSSMIEEIIVRLQNCMDYGFTVISCGRCGTHSCNINCECEEDERIVSHEVMAFLKEVLDYCTYCERPLVGTTMSIIDISADVVVTRVTLSRAELAELDWSDSAKHWVDHAPASIDLKEVFIRYRQEVRNCC
jgi:hypothetical protein